MDAFLVGHDVYFLVTLMVNFVSGTFLVTGELQKRQVFEVTKMLGIVGL